MKSSYEKTLENYILPAILAIMIFGLVFSKWILSASQFLLIIAIFSNNIYKKKLLIAFKSPLVLSIISIFIFHLIGLAWTQDFEYAAKDIQNKAPMLALPILFFAVGPLNRKTYINILLFFVCCILLFSTIQIGYNLANRIPIGEMILSQSHIRFSLLICLSLLILINFFNEFNKYAKYFVVFLMFFLMFFLFYIHSFTGYIILLLLFYLVPVLYWKNINKPKYKLAIIAIPIIITTFLLVGYSYVKSNCFPNNPTPNFSTTETTLNGNLYFFDTCNICENGNHLYMYLSFDEMISAWNNRCKNDTINKENADVLIRYLSSKNLRKDSVGVYSLSDKDVENIINGQTNYLAVNFDPYRDRIYKFLWEISIYKATKNPSGHSLTQRLEYWQTALNIIKQNHIFGVGTGDIKNAFKHEYESNNTKLDQKYRLRSHNQYLSITIALGIVGLIIFIFSIAAPFILNKIPDKKLYIGFIFIFLLSMINEDTLETQVGVTFFALFNSLLLFISATPKNTDDEKK